MSKKTYLKPETIQKLNQSGTAKEWEDEADRLSDRLDTMRVITSVIEKQDCESDIKTPPGGGNK